MNAKPLKIGARVENTAPPDIPSDVMVGVALTLHAEEQTNNGRCCVANQCLISIGILLSKNIRLVNCEKLFGTNERRKPLRFYQMPVLLLKV